MPVKILVVDDNQIERTRLLKLLSYYNEFEIKVLDCTSLNAIDQIKRIHPQIIFLEIDMRHYTGFEIANEVIKEGLNASIIYTNSSDKYAVKSIRYHAFDYLVKPVSINELKNTLNRYRSGRFNVDDAETIDIGTLSKREVDVLKEIINGSSSKEIAAKLNISKNTVNTHRSNLLKKCHVKNVVELMNKAKNLFI